MLQVDVDGALLRLRTHGDPDVADRLRRLSACRYVPESSEWILPARAEALRLVSQMLLELKGAAEVTDGARLRLRRHGPGTLEIGADGSFEIATAPHPRRLAKIRDVPDRRWLPGRRRWRIPATRAGAMALARLLDEGEVVATRDTRVLVERAGAASRSDPASPGSAGQVDRASPVAHWRHVTRGTVFDANPHRHEWVDGVGWCVRVRVDPQRRTSVSGDMAIRGRSNIDEGSGATG